MPMRLASTALSALIFISPKPGSSAIRRRNSCPSRGSPSANVTRTRRQPVPSRKVAIPGAGAEQSPGQGSPDPCLRGSLVGRPRRGRAGTYWRVGRRRPGRPRRTTSRRTQAASAKPTTPNLPRCLARRTALVPKGQPRLTWAMAIWTCDACGGENPLVMRFCGHCGAQAEAALAAPAPTESDQDVAETLRSFVAGPVAERLIEAGGEIPEERRLITALFADVSGFTSLADRLDPEQLLEVIDPVIAGLSSIVGRYEGYVEKFAGDALLALFGAPVSHEDDAARAVRVAIEMHRELSEICSRLPPENRDLTLHVGINSGHGIARILGSEARTDYAVLGDSVILAQRLESAAPAGETYVSELTHRLTNELFEYEPIGELSLKGKTEPVPAWRLVGERAALAVVLRETAE